MGPPESLDHVQWRPELKPTLLKLPVNQVVKTTNNCEGVWYFIPVAPGSTVECKWKTIKHRCGQRGTYRFSVLCVFARPGPGGNLLAARALVADAYITNERLRSPNIARLPLLGAATQALAKTAHPNRGLFYEDHKIKPASDLRISLSG